MKQIKCVFSVEDGNCNDDDESSGMNRPDNKFQHQRLEFPCEILLLKMRFALLDDDEYCLVRFEPVESNC